MIILIVKDSATQVPREVKSFEEAQAFANQGHHVLVQNEDGTKTPLAEAIANIAGQASADVITDGGVQDVVVVPAASKKPNGIVAKVKAAVTRKKK